jgi:hypothetical protein
MFNNIASVAECKKRDVEGHFMTFNTIGIVSGEFVCFQSRGFAPCKVLASKLTISGQEGGVMWHMSLLNTTNVSAVSCRCTVNGMHLNQFRKSELTKRTVQKITVANSLW